MTLDGEVIALTRKEYLILQLLLSNRGTHFSRQQIIDNVWDEDTYIGDRSVDVHIARLRKKLGRYGERIVNRTGFGYSFSIDS